MSDRVLDRAAWLRQLADTHDRAMLAQLYAEPDGEDEPTLWFAGESPHRAIVRLCDVGPDGWALIMALLTLAKRGPSPKAPRTIPSRTSDPETSRKAEPGPIRAGSQRHRLLAAFGQESAAAGLTDEEAADLADGVPYRSEFAKRCSELREVGWITVVTKLSDGAPLTRAGVSGQQRIVSAITDAGRAALARLPKPDAAV